MEATLSASVEECPSAPPAPAGKAPHACSGASACSGDAWRSSLCSTAAKIVEWWRRAAVRQIEAVRRFVRKLRRFLWRLIDSVLEEFEPWIKWVILDAVLALVVASLVRNVEPLRPVFEVVGWA